MGKAARTKAQRRLVPSPAGGPVRNGSAHAPAGSRRPAWLTPARMLLIGLGAALLVAGALIGISVTGSGSSKPATTKAVGAAATAALFRGIPQHGNVLGNPSAPGVLVEFAEPQCPICGAWARETLPTVVRDYVRPGKIKLVYHGISFIEPTSDSKRALSAIAAAGLQGKSFQLVDLLYRNQGDEGTGWITDDLIRSVGAAVPGLNVERMMADRSSTAVEKQLRTSTSAAKSVMGTQFRTPTFLAAGPSRQLAQMPISTVDQLGPEGFPQLLDQMTSR
jgi:protein-disulfide isomerase